MSNDPMDQAESAKAKLWLKITANGRPPWLKGLFSRLDAEGKPYVAIVSDREGIVGLPTVIDRVPVRLEVEKERAVGVGGLSAKAMSSAERLVHPSLRK